MLPGLASCLRPSTSQLGQAAQVFGLHGDPKDRAHAKRYHRQVESVLKGGNDASLHEALVCTHQGHDVPERHILYGLYMKPDGFLMLALFMFILAR